MARAACSLCQDEPVEELRCALTDGQKTLRFAVRYFGTQRDSAHYQARSVRAGVVGGAHSVAVTAVSSANVASVATGDTQLPWASDVAHFEATLDEPGQDVLLSIEDPLSCYTQPGEPPCPPSAVWMIDDLMLD